MNCSVRENRRQKGAAITSYDPYIPHQRLDVLGAQGKVRKSADKSWPGTVSAISESEQDEAWRDSAVSTVCVEREFLESEATGHCPRSSLFLLGWC